MPVPPSRRRRATGLLAALALGLAAFTPAAASGRAAPADPVVTPLALPDEGYGFSGGAELLSRSPQGLARELDAVARTSASWLRVPVTWRDVEKRQGSYTWAPLDRVVKAARARDLRILGVLAYSPPWAAVNTSDTAPPEDPAAYARFAKAAATRYRTEITSWEIWNEPNLARFFGGVQDSPEVLATLLRAAYPAIKSVQPGATVVTGGLSKTSNSTIAPGTFLTRLYAAGAGPYFDAVGFHPYIAGGNVVADSVRVRADIVGLYTQMTLRGDLGKKIWMTEFGNSTYKGGVTEQRQAEIIALELTTAASLPFAGPSIVYSIRDRGTNRSLAAQNFGALLTKDWRPKLTAAMLAD
ncbi:cellulase family glycosylhydrolase [Nocardioides sp. SOB77]|uniref:Cellulase family glycosylhydrolase n=1 Tax=Nocardioides oceani TaxID=3058369 RepID=A0ABT8FM57_9ACTN|nr:cellulase family glycosylhydrolase [Nocardioides oceani]MDN4175747.1 cellulase family glycosylhydrolase [Nocardioides oceani]